MKRRLIIVFNVLGLVSAALAGFTVNSSIGLLITAFDFLIVSWLLDDDT